jgi:hypothetical protein
VRAPKTVDYEGGRTDRPKQREVLGALRGAHEEIVGDPLDELRLTRSQERRVAERRAVGRRKALQDLTKDRDLLGIDVRDRHGVGPDAFEMDHAPIGELRNDESRESRERRAVIERRRQELSGLEKELEVGLLMLDSLVVVTHELRGCLGDADVETLRDQVELFDRDRGPHHPRGLEDRVAQDPVFPHHRLEVVA